METGELYSLSNSTADDSSNKSDSSVGPNFDAHLCAYQEYDRRNQLDFGNFAKCNSEVQEVRVADKHRSNERDKVLGMEDYKVKKSIPIVAMTTSSLSVIATATTTTVATAMRVCLSDDNVNDSSASGSSSAHQQMSANKSNKPKGLLNIFSTNDVDASYRNAEISMKVVHPLSSSFYKSKRASQHFKDEFMLNLTRTELRQNVNAVPQIADKSNKDHEQQLFDGFHLKSRLVKESNLPKDYANSHLEEPDKGDPMMLPGDRADVAHAEKMNSFERLRGNSLLVEGSVVERPDLRSLHGQSTSRVQNHFDALNFERMKHPSFISKDPISDNQGTTSLRPPLTRDAFMTHLQQTLPQQQQQHQQQQTKSFTIDAILGLRSSQRDKHRGQQFRKIQGQDDLGTKHVSSNSCSGSGSGGKLKRVRTIFTAEQLERLEGEFARQQYMVGPERLYLAHALRLTEAQVKVWFQNRRIKWRKVNHEQQSQRLHELHQRSLSSLEHEDSNETGEW